jgi:hypothetical protein
MRKLLGVAVCAAMLVGGGANAAFAGEITGNGKSLKPLSAKSICAFSGQNDEYVLGDETAPRTQNWGTIPKESRDFLTSVGSHPGQACNANLNPYSADDDHG